MNATPIRALVVIINPRSSGWTNSPGAAGEVAMRQSVTVTRPSGAAPAAVILAAVLAGCSGSSPTAAPVSSQAGSVAPPTEVPATPAASAPPTQAPAATPSPGGQLGGQFQAINDELNREIQALTAEFATATTPEKLAAVWRKYAGAMRKALDGYEALPWPANVQGDVDRLLAIERELLDLYEGAADDPTALDLERVQELTNELEPLARKIATGLGVAP